MGSIKWQLLPFYGSSHTGPELTEKTHEKGSSGRTRTYNPPVNRPINELLPYFAGLCFKLLPRAFALDMNGLSSCFYLQSRAPFCSELRPAFGKNLATLFSPAASLYPPNSAAKDAGTGGS